MVASGVRVVFLDIDGVLNSERYLDDYPPDEDYAVRSIEWWRQMLDPDAVARLNRILDAADASVVVASTWRYSLDLKQLQFVLEGAGFTGQVIDSTDKNSRVPRGQLAKQWLRNHPEVDGFVIVDDQADQEPLLDRFVQTSWETGLQDEHVTRACELLALPIPQTSRAQSLDAPAATRVD